MSLVIDGGGAKGDVLTVAELAGVMGGKRTAELIPLCHPLAADRPRRRRSRRTAPRACCGSAPRRPRPAPTGVEMEAMTAASVAALTVYDMVKGVERGVEIRGVRLRLEDRRQERRVAPARRRATAPRRAGSEPGERMAGRIGKRRSRR